MLTNTERQQIVEEVNAGTYGIDEALDDIAAAQKGEEVRKALYAEALVLNREGHAGSTDMIARQQIANLQTSVNGQISTLRTEVGEDIDDLETTLNSSLATQNGKIAAQNATIANVVANYNVEYGSTELWASTGETGALAAGTTVTLSEDVSNFDYIDIYSFCGNSNVLDTVPVDAKLQSSQGYALRWVNLSDPGSGSYKAYVRIIETRLHIIGTTLTIDHQVTYRNGEEVDISGAEITQSNRSTYMGELGIMKIVGRKITANTEIEDVRIGADGTEYASAGQAVRAQVTALESAIPAVDSTLSTQGAAADAKIVGDELTNVKADLAEYEQIFTADVDESVSNWLNEHPEATTTVQDGSLTEAKFTDDLKDQILSTNIDSINVSAYKTLNFSDFDVLGLNFQCCTYDSNRNNYIFVFTDNTDAKIVTITEDFQTINTYDVLNAYHANDITYCVSLDKLYLATMTNNVLEINPDDMSVVSSIDIGERIAQISYDADNDVMYLGNTDTNTVIYKYNTSFERIETYSEFTWQSLYNLLGLSANQNLVGQSMCNVGENLYLVVYTWDSNREINLAGYIILIGNTGNYGAKFSTAFAGEEPESLMLKNNTGILSSWRKLGTVESQLILYNASLSKKFVFNNDPYFRGMALHDIDLNDVIVPNNYFSKNTATTSTIANAPVTTSFTLLVRSQGYENIRQILFADASNKIFTRVIYLISGYIENWYEIVFSNAVTPTKQTFVNNGITFTFAYNAYMVGISTSGSFTNATTTSWITLGTAPISSMPMLALHTDNNTEVLIRINNGNLQYITKSSVAAGGYFPDAASAFR